MPNNMNTPINRNNLFYSKEDFDFEMDLVEGYLEEDTNQTVVVYQVDKITTQVNDIYKEANKNIHFLVFVCLEICSSFKLCRAYGTKSWLANSPFKNLKYPATATMAALSVE